MRLLYTAACKAFLPLYDGSNGENLKFNNGITKSNLPSELAQNK